MQITVIKQGESGYPVRLDAISGPPKQLYCRGAPLQELLKLQTVAIVGSRKISSYGRQVTYDFARRLAEQGIVIISGLALGVDTEAHEAALMAGTPTIAVLPSPVDRIYPATNTQLAERIVAAGGAVISEYGLATYQFKQNFVARNRIVAGLADVIIITEAAIKSGSLHTADFATAQGKPVFAVPGSILSPSSVGANNLIKQARALAVTDFTDILKALDRTTRRTPQRKIRGANPQEQHILNLLNVGIADADDLFEAAKLDISTFNQTITTLEITSKIRSLGNNNWGII